MNKEAYRPVAMRAAASQMGETDGKSSWLSHFRSNNISAPICPWGSKHGTPGQCHFKVGLLVPFRKVLLHVELATHDPQLLHLAEALIAGNLSRSSFASYLCGSRITLQGEPRKCEHGVPREGETVSLVSAKTR